MTTYAGTSMERGVLMFETCGTRKPLVVPVKESLAVNRPLLMMAMKGALTVLSSMTMKHSVATRPWGMI